MTSRIRIRSFFGAFALVLAVLVVAPSASAQDEIVVNSATPDMAEQGTYDLEVVLGGDNFPSDAEVDFFITGTEDPGGITVLGKPKRQGPKTLKVKIDVAEDAQTQLKFDVRVRSRRGGRSGKGTELFRVTQKQHPTQDTIAPGMPMNLTVLEVGYSTVKLSWTMPADDGYDISSGSPSYCHVTDDDPDLIGNPWWAWAEAGGWVEAGEAQTIYEVHLQPEATYQLGVWCRDEANNQSPESQVIVQTRPFSDFRDSSWSIEQLPFAVGDLIGHGVDLGGDVVYAGSVITGRGKGRWKPVYTAIRVATGSWDAGAWSWSYQDVPGFANRMRMHPQGGAAFAGLNVLDAVNLSGGGITFNRELLYTFRDGAAWVTELVAADAGYFSGLPGFAFDAQGDPAIAWCYESEGAPGGIRLARRSDSGDWTVEAVNSVACEHKGQSSELAFDDQGNPAILYAELLQPGDPFSSQLLHLATWTGLAWVDEIVADPSYQHLGDPSDPVGVEALLFDGWQGGFVGAGGNDTRTNQCVRLGYGSWQCEAAFEGGSFGSDTFGDMNGRYTVLGSDWLLQDLTGDLVMPLSTLAWPDVALARRQLGLTGWDIENVAHPSEFGYPKDVGQQGPFVAFDMLDLPTLSWTWDGVAYFAWKETP